MKVKEEPSSMKRVVLLSAMKVSPTSSHTRFPALYEQSLNNLHTVIRHYPLMAVVSTAHPLAHRASIQRRELKGYPLVDIVQRADKYGEAATITNAFTRAGFLPDIQYISDDIEISLLAVATGIGYALLPTYITDSITSRDKVTAIPIEGEEEEMTLVAAWHKDYNNPALQKFLENYILK